MTYAPGTSKRLLDLVSSAAHEIVTRKKLSRNIKRSATLVSEALQGLLADDLGNLPGVLELLDEAATLINRPSSSLNGARDLINGTPKPEAEAARPTSASKKGSGKKTAGKKTAGKKTAGKKSAGKRSASKKVAGKKASAKRAGKKASGKKTSDATGAATRAVGKKAAGKRSAGAKRVAKKTVARS